ncbi:Protein of unknown function [Escherichia coli]|nr:Protein of unknown function [Escherichia coli D6-113.11]CDP72906.1 Protein of unknown function [Escherichia coli]CDU32538.1 Protein of unknown function [Escherichia coli D6-113.11]CDU40097.1 Protein of unknown function [Escherichia coli]
MASAAVGAR